MSKIGKPFVSVVTPTYNRRRFIPSLLKCFTSQDYPKDRMEFIILDDGSDKIQDLIDAANLLNVRYIPLPEKLNIGAKRNLLNKEAKGDIIVCMDDDDYYPPERVSHVVHMLTANPIYELCGSSEIYMYYSDIQKIYRLGPYAKFHATNGTMAYKRSYIQTHSYDETVTHAEETSFLNRYREPLLQLDPFKVMLVMSHSENTFDKKKMREIPNPMVNLTSMKIKNFIKKDAALRNFYATA
jgi:glycosyltransferase involved in cell wall biosynthesis